MLALGAAMVFGNVIAIVRRNRDRKTAREALQQNTRTSRQITATLARNQVKEGKATLAVAPLGRSLVFVAIGFFVAIFAAASLFH